MNIYIIRHAEPDYARDSLTECSCTVEKHKAKQG